MVEVQIYLLHSGGWNKYVRFRSGEETMRFLRACCLALPAALVFALWPSPKTNTLVLTKAELVSGLAAQQVNRRPKRDPLYAIVLKKFPDKMWDIEGPMSIREARAYNASDPGYKVYVEGTEDYDNVILVYWPEEREWTAIGHGIQSLPGENMAIALPN